MRMAGARDKDKYPSRSARTRKSTSTSKMFWESKTSPRISVPTTNSTWPIFRWREMPIFVWFGAALFKEAQQHLRDSGVDQVSSPRNVTGARGPATSVYFRDPDGNLWEFVVY